MLSEYTCQHDMMIVSCFSKYIQIFCDWIYGTHHRGQPMFFVTQCKLLWLGAEASAYTNPIVL